MTTSTETEASPETEFKLESNNSDFNAKSKDVFGSLALLEKKHEAYEKVRSKKDDVIKSDPVVDRVIDDRGRGGRGQFQRPRGRGRGKPYVPMYRREPRKWTMYDLSDVDPATMSDKSTRQAAMSFLADLKKRKEASVDEHDTDEKIVFKKPKTSDPPTDKSASAASTSGGKIVMPEFNFGAKKDKPKKKKMVKSDDDSKPGSSIHLSHLDYDDDGDEG